jgi:hypothetical protein
MATLLPRAFDQYACNNRTDLSQLVDAALSELMMHPERSYLMVQTLCNAPSDKPTTFTVRYNAQQRAWDVYSTRAGVNRSFQYKSTQFARGAVRQMIQQNYCRVMVQTKHYPYYYLSSQINLFN